MKSAIAHRKTFFDCKLLKSSVFELQKRNIAQNKAVENRVSEIGSKSAIAPSQVKICPHAPTTHAQFTNPFRTHFRTHIARAEVRFYAHVRRNPTSGSSEQVANIYE